MFLVVLVVKWQLGLFKPPNTSTLRSLVKGKYGNILLSVLSKSYNESYLISNYSIL